MPPDAASPPDARSPVDADLPLDAAELGEALREFGRSRMLPRAAYTSERVLAFELERLFAGSWVCVARAEDLASPGDRLAVQVGEVGALVVRDGDGDLRAFANVCRHRGHELLAAGASTSARSLVCPYHAWSYRLDGSLRAAPGMRDATGFDASGHRLVRLPLEVWHGFVMVNASGDAPPLDQHLGALDELVAPYRPERLVAMASREYQPRANWKVLCENYHECYHCPRIHPELCRVSPPTSGRNHELPGAWVGGSMDLREHAATMSLDGRSGGAPIQGLDRERLRTVEYLHLLPNLLLSLHPDYLMTHLIEPLSPLRSKIACRWYFPPETAELPGFDPAYAVEFWDRTNRQDWAACESVQRGMANPHFRPGPLAPGEDAVYRFETLIARAYLGEYPGSPWGGEAAG
jgi:phenylpropionate dioxygenase-like ring-hydroxylating dioxygenase large terminal subunit